MSSLVVAVVDVSIFILVVGLIVRWLAAVTICVHVLLAID